MVMRVKHYDKLRLDLEYSEDKLGQVAPGGGRYYFEIGYKENLIKLYLKEGIIPEEFIAYSKLSHKCKAENVEMKARRLRKIIRIKTRISK